MTINVTVNGQEQGGASPAAGAAPIKPIVLKGDDRIKKITLKRMDPKKLSKPTPAAAADVKKPEPVKKEAEKKDDKSNNENK